MSARAPSIFASLPSALARNPGDSNSGAIGVGPAVGLVEGDGPREHRLDAIDFLRSRAAATDLLPGQRALQPLVVGLRISRRRQPRRLRRGQLDCELRGHLARELHLQRHGVDQCGLVALRPNLPVRGGVDEPQRHAYGTGLAAHAALEYVGRAELASQRLHGGRPAAVHQHRGPRDHFEVARPGTEGAQQLLMDAIREERVLRVGTRVLEGQHGQAID